MNQPSETTLTLTGALLTAIGTLATVVVPALTAVIVYLWRELRSQYRARAADSALYLNAHDALQRRYSESQRPPPDRLTPTDNPRASSSAKLSRATSQTRE